MTEYSNADIEKIKQEAYDEGKLEFREVLDSVATNRTTPSFSYCKKPEQYRPVQDDIRKYLERWDVYRRLVNIKDPIVTRVFCTFLDDVSLNKLLDNLNATQKDSWEVAKPLIIELLEPTYLRFQAKAKLVRATQIHNESVEDFITRITELGNHAFKDDEKVIRDRLILDTFLAGLKSQQMVVMLYSKLGPSMNLADARAEAMNLEIAVRSRAIVHGEEYDEFDNEQEGQVCTLAVGSPRIGSDTRYHKGKNVVRRSPCPECPYRYKDLAENEGPVWENEEGYDYSDDDI